MYDLPRTPQTLLCDDEDPFFVFHEDGSVDNNSVDVEIGFSRRNTPTAAVGSSCFMPEDNHRNTVRKELDKQAKTEETVRTRGGGRSLRVRQSMRQKRKQYSKRFSRSNISNKIKTAMQAPVKTPSTSDNAGWQRHRVRDENRLYYFLEDKNECSPLVPDDFSDDKSSSCQSLPARFATSLSWKKRPSVPPSSASATSLAPRVSKLKWNRMIQVDCLSTFKAYPESSPPLIPTASSRTPRTTELASSSSTVSSSAASCTSSLKSADDRTKRFTSPRLESRLKEGLYNIRVEEEEDEDSDSDSEDDIHPDAGSFAFAIGRRSFDDVL